MTLVQTFLTGLALSLLLSLVIVLYLNAPLTNLLIDVCGTEARAKFWTHITNLSFVLMALLMAIINRPSQNEEPIFHLSKQMGWTLFGQILTVLIVTKSISRFIRRGNQ